MRRSSVFASIALVALPLAACVAPSAPPPRPAPPVAVPTPAPTPTPPPPPPTSADWRDWPLTPGNWRYAPSGSGNSSAVYGSVAPDFVFRISCAADRRSITLERASSLGGSSMTIRTTSTARTLPTLAAQHPDSPPVMTHAAALPANDSLLDAIGYSRGRFIVESAGAPPLVIPAWSEIQRVIEDCRG